VTVYYDPDDPSVAVLNAGYKLQAYAIISAGLMGLAGGMFFFRRWRRRQARRNIFLGK
jgi:LPXTG-motif cell wall-anchored protein